MVNQLNRIEERVVKVEEILCVILALTMVVVVFAQIVSRGVLGKSLGWSEEFSRYAFVWLSMIGSALAVSKSAHLGIDTLVESLPVKVKKVVMIIINAILTVFLVIMVVQGINLVQRTSAQLSAAMRISMKYAYMAIPVGGGLMAYHTLMRIVNSLARLENLEENREEIE